MSLPSPSEATRTCRRLEHERHVLKQCALIGSIRVPMWIVSWCWSSASIFRPAMLVCHRLFHVNEALFVLEEDAWIVLFFKHRTIPTVDGDEISGEKTTLGYRQNSRPRRSPTYQPTGRTESLQMFHKNPLIIVVEEGLRRWLAYQSRLFIISTSDLFISRMSSFSWKSKKYETRNTQLQGIVITPPLICIVSW